MATDETTTGSSPADYSATKAPENRPHVESQAPSKDHTLKPGGRHGATAAIGMSELDRDAVPSGATDPAQTDYGNRSIPGPGGSDRD